MSEDFKKALAQANEALTHLGQGEFSHYEWVTENGRSYRINTRERDKALAAARAAMPTQPRRFYLKRTKDISGVSGVGIVAEGCVFANHRCVLSWLPVTTSFEIFDNVEDLLKIHGHNGCTTIQYLDPA
jgi:hypothetical protein